MPKFSDTMTVANNRIGNSAQLNELYQKMFMREKDSFPNISILHIGDSHIQADMGTEILRKNFQMYFGSPGRGLIFPLKVAKTNEPNNYKTFSKNNWKSKRSLAVLDTSLAIGVCGFTIKTQEKNAKMRVQSYDKYGINHNFNEVSFFVEPNGKNLFDIEIQDTFGKNLGFYSFKKNPSQSGYFSIQLPDTLHAVDLIFGKKEGKEITVYGMVLNNKNNQGIHYHSVGVNGAQYQHYNASKHFFQQAAHLKPELVIVSLGTNEAFYPLYKPEIFYNQVDTFVQGIYETCGKKTKILITIPADHFKKEKSNAQLKSVREQLLKYANDNKLMTWDLYEITGGENSCENWKKAGLIQKDGVHFTRNGYQFQGNLLFDALIQGYYNYVESRSPKTH